MTLKNKTIFENIYKFDDCHIRICVHYDESLDLLSLVVIVAQHNGSFNSFLKCILLEMGEKIIHEAEHSFSRSRTWLHLK